MPSPHVDDAIQSANSSAFPGGKAKPLKAAKKEKRELDEEDLAFKERQRAGMLSYCVRDTNRPGAFANCC